ncbi:MAG: hypothetical protein MUQ30_06225, partial [Anaerolineae bacterium]|nr:hypothetical protein [Anaerolineae bacterium]
MADHTYNTGKYNDMTRRKTAVTIEGNTFLVNGAPTYAGRTYMGTKVEGLLLNSRVVQGTF